MPDHSNSTSDRAAYSKYFNVLGGGLCLIIISIFAVSAVGLDFGSLRAPGPGLWPLSMSVCGIILSVILTIFGKDIPGVDTLTSLTQISLYLLALIAFPLLYYYLGFIPASILVLLVLMWKAARYSLFASLSISILSSFIIYMVFAYGLALQIEGFW